MMKVYSLGLGCSNVLSNYRIQVVAAFGGQEDVFKTLLAAKSDATCPPDMGYGPVLMVSSRVFESLEHIETFKTPSITLNGSMSFDVLPCRYLTGHLPKVNFTTPTGTTISMAAKQKGPWDALWCSV